MVFLETMLESRFNPLVALARAGTMGLAGLVNKFNAEAELLDDLVSVDNATLRTPIPDPFRTITGPLRLTRCVYVQRMIYAISTVAGLQRERNWLIEQFQQLARVKRIRVTFVSGDVHCGAVGVLKTLAKGKHSVPVPPAQDYRYMVNVVSSTCLVLPTAPFLTQMM